MSIKKIAIVGAGPSGLAAAFHLTDPKINPDWKNQYEIDVYQLGWRAGGKGATGRNIDACERIQEHGIHVFGNLYFNAFGMISECYQELTERTMSGNGGWDEFDPTEARKVETAFIPSNTTLITDYFKGEWRNTIESFPYDPAVPWKDPVFPTSRQMAQHVLSMVSEKLIPLMTKPDLNESLLHRIWDDLRHPARGAVDGLTVLAKEIIIFLDHPASGDPVDEIFSSRLVSFLDRTVGLMKLIYEFDSGNEIVRRTYISADIIAAVIRGIHVDVKSTQDVHVIDDVNYIEWLKKHGASQVTLDSDLPAIFPNTSFSYLHGDSTRKPSMSAAAYVQFLLRQLYGQGAGAYFFSQGTGETVIKPLYMLLAQRGVRIHFFHKLTEVTPDPQTNTINELNFDVQATVRGGGLYNPLRRMKGSKMLVWPDRPSYDQLNEGEQMLAAMKEKPAGNFDLESWWTEWKPVGKKTLKMGTDFDQVVLATPVGTLKYTCQGLINHPTVGDTWKNMAYKIETAATQNVQIWLNKPLEELGWMKTLLPGDRLVGAVYKLDLNCFCDFSDLVKKENWPDGNTPAGLLYFNGPLSDPEQIPPFDDHQFPARMKQRLLWSTVQYFRNVTGFLPKAVDLHGDPRALDVNLLSAYDPEHRGRGVNIYEQQYYRANIDPNERYTLSAPGTAKHRLSAWDSGFDNLVLTGDWIHTGFNVGSFEGATIGGKLACLAMIGKPDISQIYGYTFLHPDYKRPDHIRLPSAMGTTAGE